MSGAEGVLWLDPYLLVALVFDVNRSNQSHSLELVLEIVRRDQLHTVRGSPASAICCTFLREIARQNCRSLEFHGVFVRVPLRRGQARCKHLDIAVLLCL